MYLLTVEEGNLESGAYASVDTDGTTIVQFFVDKDDAIVYNTQLGALGYELFVTELDSDNVDKMCDLLGYAYSIVEPGEIVVPRLETMKFALEDDSVPPAEI